MTKKVQRVELVPYDPRWPRMFEEEAEDIKQVLGNNCIAIHHIGSTSIPGLLSKPKIDIIAVVENPTESIQQLEKIGIGYRGEYNIPMHYGFSKRGDINVNLHVYELGHPEIELNLLFRDYLRAHSDVRDAYAAVKMDLLKKPASHEKKNAMFTGYTLAKGSFVRKVLRSAGFERLRLLKCSDGEEWEAAKSFRQRYFFDKASILDPYEWTFSHADHVHFVLYLGVDIIGYAHVQLWPDSRAAIRIIVVDEAHRAQGFGRQLMEWLETWLRNGNYRSVHAESSADALEFYRKLAYVDMPFDDPDGYTGAADDTPVGKML